MTPLLVLVGGLQVEDDVAVHLHEAPVGIVREARIAGLADQAFDGLVVQPEVQDGVHHPRHRRTGARPHRHQQRLGGITEAAAGDLLDACHGLAHLLAQNGRIGAAVGIVVRAHLGRDGQARRDRQPELGHLGQVGALAAQQVLHVGAAVGPSAAEAVHVLGSLGGGSRLGLLRPGRRLRRGLGCRLLRRLFPLRGHGTCLLLGLRRPGSGAAQKGGEATGRARRNQRGCAAETRENAGATVPPHRSAARRRSRPRKGSWDRPSRPRGSVPRRAERARWR
jgi:hypothetical protein